MDKIRELMNVDILEELDLNAAWKQIRVSCRYIDKGVDPVTKEIVYRYRNDVTCHMYVVYVDKGIVTEIESWVERMYDYEDQNNNRQ